MTLAEIEKLDRDFLSVQEVADCIHCEPQLIRDEAGIDWFIDNEYAESLYYYVIYAENVWGGFNEVPGKPVNLQRTHQFGGARGIGAVEQDVLGKVCRVPHRDNVVVESELCEDGVHAFIGCEE